MNTIMMNNILLILGLISLIIGVGVIGLLIDIIERLSGTHDMLRIIFDEQYRAGREKHRPRH